MPADNHTDPALEQSQPPIHPEQSVEEKLDVIIKYLHRIDKRDRIRMWSGTIHSLMTLIPLVLTLLSLWYFYTHSTEILGDVMKGMIPGGNGGADQQSVINQIQEYFRQQQGQ